jgi:hypothetical protein
VRTGKRLAALLAAGAIVGAIFTASSSGSPGSHGRVVTMALSAPPGTPVLAIGGLEPAPPVASGFLGLSMEFSALPAYAGDDPQALDPVFEQLIRNLAPGQRPVLRIGGDSTDRTWVPVPGMAKPAGIRYTVTPDWLEVAGALAQALDAQMIVGIDLEVDSPQVAGAEGQAMLAAIGAPWLQALELGNEPEIYGTFPWYRRNGHGVTGRPKAWNVASYLRDISKITPALPPGVPLAAPATGAAKWMAAVGRIADAEPRMAVATVHRYPLDRCFTARSSSQYPTIPNLLAPASSDGLADSVIDFANTAHAHHLAVRVDEFNSVSCSGKRGVSDTFASALWALDATFAMARAGVDGVNIHTFPGAIYQPFRLRYQDGAWQAGIRPEYYGLMMFAQAAPPGARLLKVSGSASGVRPWATRAPDGVVHVVLVNDALHGTRSVAVRIPTTGRAALEWLRAPSVSSTSGVTLGGQSFGAQTSTGLLSGPAASSDVAPVGGRYVVRLPAASAAMLTLSGSS